MIEVILLLVLIIAGIRALPTVFCYILGNEGLLIPFIIGVAIGLFIFL